MQHKKGIFLPFALFALLLLLSGCGATIADLSEYAPRALDDCDLMPTPEQYKKAGAKVVIIDFNENDIPTAREARLGSSAAGNLESHLSKGGAVELVDREIAGKLRDEIILAEMEQTGAYEGPAVAEFAISGTIDGAGFSSRFQEGYTTVDKKGQKYYHPPKFIYTAEVNGKIRIYEVPSLKVVKTIVFNDSARRSEETRSSRRPASNDDNLVRSAAADGIRSARIELMNFFAKKGYILEKRAKKKDTIFKVSLGTADGVNTGDSCQLFTLAKNTNPITGEECTEEILLGKGKVSNRLGADYAWLIVAEDELQQAPRLGDYVKVRYKKGLGDALHTTGKLLNALSK